MADFYFSESGDVRVTTSGDLALTDDIWRDDAQQAYIRIMTEPGDFLTYPFLGTQLSDLYGMPQTETTGNYGAQLITQALAREGVFQGKPVTVTPVPIGPQTIRFDIFIANGARDKMILQIEQDLGVI